MLTKLLTDLYIISLLDDEPNDVGGMSSAELKAKFDEAANIIKDYINNTLIPELAGNGGAESVGIDTVPGLTGVSTVQAALVKIEEQMAEMTQGAVADESITTAKLAALAVTSAKLAAAAVETAKIKDEAVTTPKLAALAVTAARLADLAVETAKIKDKAVTTEKIADKAVTTAQLGDASVGTAQLDALSVTAAKLAALAVETAKIKDKAVTGAKIADGSVTQANLSVNARCGLVISASAGKNLKNSDAGNTYYAGWTSTGSVKTWTLNAELSAAISDGFAVAFTELWPSDKTRISISGVRLLHRGEGTLLGKSQSAVLGLVERCNMIALQKMSTDATNGDVWLITGDVEVVS